MFFLFTLILENKILGREINYLIRTSAVLFKLEFERNDTIKKSFYNIPRGFL